MHKRAFVFSKITCKVLGVVTVLIMRRNKLSDHLRKDVYRKICRRTSSLCSCNRFSCSKSNCADSFLKTSRSLFCVCWDNFSAHAAHRTSNFPKPFCVKADVLTLHQISKKILYITLAFLSLFRISRGDKRLGHMLPLKKF